MESPMQITNGGRSCENRRNFFKVLRQFALVILMILRRQTIRLTVNVVFGCESELWRLLFGVN